MTTDRHIYFSLLLILSGFLFSLPCGAQAPAWEAEEAGDLQEQFESAARSIAASSPVLRASLLEAESDAESVRAENVLPGPEIEGQYLWGSHGAGAKRGASVSQSFDWPGAYVARRRAAGKAADAVEALRLAEYADRLTEARAALTELIGARKRIALCREIKENMDSLCRLVEEGFRRGEMTRIDVNKTRIERIRADRDLADAELAESDALSSIAALSGGTVLNPEGLTDYPVPRLESLEEYERRAEENNPRRAYLRASLESARAMAKAGRAASLPGFSLGYGYENESGEKFHGFTASVNLPQWNRRSRDRVARLEAEALEIQEMAEADNSLIRVRADYRRASRLRDELREYAPAVEGTDNTGLLRKAYLGGQISLIEYLRELAYFTDAQRAFLDTELEYRLTIVALEKYGR